jgi:hypothetical protein
MAQPRSELQAILLGITDNVYFQPPANVTMKYPAIVYSRDFEDTKFAGNKLYGRQKRYQIIVIDRDPDSTLPDAVGDLPLCSFVRHYTANNLNHDVYELFF